MIKSMDPLLLLHNSHLEDPDRFSSTDPQLRCLAGVPLVHEPALLGQLPAGQPGIYSIGGARQVGKTTRILARTHAPHTLEGIPVEPLPLALLRIEGASASRFLSHS